MGHVCPHIINSTKRTASLMIPSRSIISLVFQKKEYRMYGITVSKSSSQVKFQFSSKINRRALDVLSTEKSSFM